jgi:hypothetical protein
MYFEWMIAFAVGISLSACCGFRIFVPLLVASTAAKLGWLPLSQGFDWMGSFPAIIAFATASVLEIAGYYIPVIDNALDVLAAPCSVAAGILVSASAFVEFTPLLKWTLAIIAGGGMAGIIHAGTGLVRLGSTKTTAGIGNPIVSTIENVLSVVGSIFSLLVPVLMLCVFVGSTFFIGYFTYSRFIGKRLNS